MIRGSVMLHKFGNKPKTIRHRGGGITVWFVMRPPTSCNNIVIGIGPVGVNNFYKRFGNET